MRKVPLTTLAVCLGLASFQPAYAGAPLKGVDVKLGRNPGGSVAARTTDAAGNVDFGVLPAGSYTIEIASGAAQHRVHVTVQGAAGGAMSRDIDTDARARVAPVSFAVSGRAPLRVSVESGAGPVVGAARIKSHSNSTNN